MNLGSREWCEESAVASFVNCPPERVFSPVLCRYQALLATDRTRLCLLLVESVAVVGVDEIHENENEENQNPHQQGLYKYPAKLELKRKITQKQANYQT